MPLLQLFYWKEKSITYLAIDFLINPTIAINTIPPIPLLTKLPTMPPVAAPPSAAPPSAADKIWPPRPQPTIPTILLPNVPKFKFLNKAPPMLPPTAPNNYLIIRSIVTPLFI